MARSSLAYAADYIEEPDYSKGPKETPKVSSYTIQIGETIFAPPSEDVDLTLPVYSQIAYETVLGGWLTGIALSDYPNDPNSAAPAVHVRDPLWLSATIEAAQEPTWREPTVLGLARVLQLPDGWDSYGAPRVQQKAANSALHLLESAAGADAPAPIVVPTSDGGVQLEWHAWGLDVELAVPPSQAPELFFRDRRSATESDRELGADLGPLSEALRILTERAGQERGR